jgi:hypothetical protein
MRERQNSCEGGQNTCRAVYTDARPRLYRSTEGCLYACESRLYRCETSSIRVRGRPSYSSDEGRLHDCSRTFYTRMQGLTMRVVYHRCESCLYRFRSRLYRPRSLQYGSDPFRRSFVASASDSPPSAPGLAASVQLRAPSSRLSTRAVLPLLAGRTFRSCSHESLSHINVITVSLLRTRPTLPRHTWANVMFC